MIKTKIYINNELIDLKEEISIPLNFSIADIREPDKRSTTWSKTVTLPGSSFNNKLFSNLWNVNTNIISTGTTNFAPSFNPNLKAIAEITYNEASQFKGICQLLNINVTDNYQIEYEVAFFGELQNIYQTFNNSYLRNLDLSEYDHNYTRTNIENSWTAPKGIGYVYSMIDYGYQLNNRFKLTEIFPSIYVKTIIDKMFSQAGFSYNSDFFNSEIFKSLTIPYNGNSSLKMSDTAVKNKTCFVTKTSNQNIDIKFKNYYSYPIIFQDKTTPPNFDPNNNFIPYYTGTTGNKAFIVPKDGVYKITADVQLSVTHQPSSGTVYLNGLEKKIGELNIVKNSQAMDTNLGYYQPIASTNIVLADKVGNPYSEFNTNNFLIYLTSSLITKNTTTNVFSGKLAIETWLAKYDKIELKVADVISKSSVEPIDKRYIYTTEIGGGTLGSAKEEVGDNSFCTINVISGSTFSVSLKDTKITENETVEINQILPNNIKQSDFFNSIIKAFNLFVEIDKANSRKLNIEPRNTFYSSGTTVDWSEKLDESKETKIIPLGELNNKSYIFKYKDDSDYFNSDYKKTYAEVYGQKRYDIENDFLKGELNTELIFSPTPLVDTIGHDRVISKIYTIDENSQIKPSASNIRVLYYGGLITTLKPWVMQTESGEYAYSNYAYAGHLNSVDNPTFDLSFGIPKQVYYTARKYTANNLYNKYWRDYIEQIADKDSKIFVGYFLLNEWDIQSLDFRNRFYFKNEYWRLNKIVDYDAMSNQPTRCEFIKLKEY